MGCFISFNPLTSSGKMWEGTLGRTERSLLTLLALGGLLAKQRAILDCDVPLCSVSYGSGTSSWVKEGSGGRGAADNIDRYPVTCILGSSALWSPPFCSWGRRVCRVLLLLPSLRFASRRIWVQQILGLWPRSRSAKQEEGRPEKSYKE